jgi:hypothetical protein
VITEHHFVANAWNMPLGMGSDVDAIYQNELARGFGKEMLDRALGEDRNITCFLINDPDPVGCAGYFDVETDTGPIAFAFFHVNPGYRNKRAILKAVKKAFAACPHSRIFASRDYNIESSGRFLHHFGFREYPWLNSPLLLLLR